MTTALPVLECPTHGVIAIENAVFTHTFESNWTARFTGETRAVPTGEEDADGNLAEDASGDPSSEDVTCVEPVDFIDANEHYSITCPEELCGLTIETGSNVWHILDKFDNMGAALQK